MKSSPSDTSPSAQQKNPKRQTGSVQGGEHTPQTAPVPGRRVEHGYQQPMPEKQLRRDGEEVEQHISTAQQVGPPPPVQAEQKERQGSKGRNSCMAKPHFPVIVP